MTGISATIGRIQPNRFGAVDAADALGLATDGSEDSAAPLQNFIDSLPDVRGNLAGQFPGEPSVSFNTSGTMPIVLPGVDRTGKPLRYRFDSEVVVPGNKSISFTSGAPQSAILENNSTNEWIFRMDGTGVANGAVSEFSGFAFWKGGLRYEGRFRGAIETHHNLFLQTPGPAIRYVNGTDTFAPISFQNYANYYMQCAGAEWVEGIQAGIVGRSFRNRYLWNRDTPIIVDGAIYKIVDNDFQLMERTLAPTKPFVLLRGQDEPTSLVTIRENRFAPEYVNAFPDGLDYSAPFAAIQAGEVASDTTVVANINVYDNQFLGRAVADPTAGVGQYALAFFHRPVNCHVANNNNFQNLTVAAVGEQWTAGGTLTTGGPDRNTWGVNDVAGAPLTFEHGGDSWLA